MHEEDGDFHVDTDDTGEDHHATSMAFSRLLGSNRDSAIAPWGAAPAPDARVVKSWTPWMSTPAANRSEFRASASAVR